MGSNQSFGFRVVGSGFWVQGLGSGVWVDHTPKIEKAEPLILPQWECARVGGGGWVTLGGRMLPLRFLSLELTVQRTCP